MKKIAVFLSVLSLLAASGCSNAKNAPAGTTSEEPLFTVVLDDQPETTAEQTDLPTESTTTAASEETETIAETTVVSEETTGLQTESTVPTETTVPETTAEPIPAVQDTADLMGTWEYVNGYRFRFMEENAAEMQVNYSSTLFFSDDRLCYDGGQYTPVVDEENIFVTLDDGTTLLHLTALERRDAANFNGRYRLEDCQFYKFLTEGYADRPTYEIDVEGGAFRVVMDAQYHASEDGILELVQNGSSLKLQYIVKENSMIIYDENGEQDTLMRVE